VASSRTRSPRRSSPRRSSRPARSSRPSTTPRDRRASAAEASGLAPGVVALMIGFALAGFGINATQVGAYTVGAHVYATDVRSSGVGAAAGLGRIGGILSAFAGGALLTWFGGPGFFVALSVVVVLTLAGILLVRKHIPPR